MRKNIFINYTNNRFTNSIISSDVNFATTNLEGNIYEIYYQSNMDFFIFNLSNIDYSVSEFINEFYQQKSIAIYIDTEDSKYIEYIHSIINNDRIKLIIPESIENKFDSSNKIIFYDYVINTKLFYDTNSTKYNDYVCFLDNVKTIPTEINNNLYPNTQYKIKLYNNPDLSHPQNLGILTEIDKAEILKASKTFIAINNHYVYEARACGCRLVNEKMKNINIDNIKTVDIEDFIERITA
jgi:hypothetical protein